MFFCGLVFLPSGVFACLHGLARFLVPGLYEVIQYIISLNKHGVSSLAKCFCTIFTCCFLEHSVLRPALWKPSPRHLLGLNYLILHT